ncbi:UPF0764 protein C16orf89 homolog isoform X2 [Bradysia coprophila]|nr:UPF0764 protein C16orf89 homolog isoform X2 [Bradysia coprophila]
MQNTSESPDILARMRKNLQWIVSASTWETPDVKQWRTLLEHDADIDTAEDVAMDTDFGKYSDGCIFGTFEHCDIPDYCIEFLWREPHSGYLLTHQILFHYMIVQNNCFSGGKRIFYESQKLVHPKKFLETMCRRVLTEANLIVSLNYPYSHQDLFVEQILVCSLAGFNDFLTRDWTNVILGWSSDDGLLGCYTSQSKKIWKKNNKRRVKRWDHILAVGNVECSVHMGALILGVIGQQLRYFLEICHDS